MNTQKSLNLSPDEMVELSRRIGYAVPYEDRSTKEPFYVVHTDKALFDKLSHLDKRNDLFEPRDAKKVGEFSLVINEGDFRTLQNLVGEFLEREMPRERTIH